MQHPASVIGTGVGALTPAAAQHWVFAGTAAVLEVRDRAAMFTDGPFPESKEYLAGFWASAADDLEPVSRLVAGGSA
ncbi:hypothetical protein WEH80_09240 [Actinomycetes bacterium KLBMP 9759]